MKHSRVRDGEKWGEWTLHEPLGRGGNGSVYRATCPGRDPRAIKILDEPRRDRRYDRFRAEIDALKLCQDISGVVHLLDSSTPDEPTRSNPPWYVMGLAEPLEKALDERAPLERIVEVCAAVARVLVAVHAKGIAHRDIKPENLFWYRDQWAVGDFGLADFDEKEGFTREGEKVGPMFYIAPEMLNAADRADGKPADVYSLAKTLWKLATGQTYPIPGEQRRTVAALTLSAYVRHGRASLLDAPLEMATRHEPGQRPTMVEFLHELESWLRAPTVREGPVELIDLIPEIRAINHHYYVSLERASEERKFISEHGSRIRELFRTVFNEIFRAFQEAGFVKSRGDFDNSWSGFEITGLLAGPRTVKLKLRVDIRVAADGNVRVTCSYVGQIQENGQNTDLELWRDEAAFPAGGSVEIEAVGRLLVNIRAALPPCVMRSIEMARGA